MPGIFRVLDKMFPLYRFLYRVILEVCKVLLVCVIGLVVIAVVGRYIPGIPNPVWTSELVLTGMGYIAVLSAALAIRRKAHIRMTAFDNFLPSWLLRVLDIVTDIGVLVLAYIMIRYGWRTAVGIGATGMYTSLPNLSRFWMYLPVPIAGVAMIVFQLESLYRNIRGIFVKEEELQ